MTRPIYRNSAIPPEHGLPKPGDTVGGGKYRIDSTLGRGGMGAVYAVTHCITHKRFAIKWLLAQAAESAEAVRRFIREAQIAGRVRHPNVIEVYDIYQEPEGLFLVMELLEGESLEARVQRQRRLEVGEALSYLLPSMEGIAAAHAAGVVHRDIKPANIYLCRTPDNAGIKPKVLDFGVSRLASVPGHNELTTTRSGTVIGTPHYMAPEQMRSATVDERADVYALGITLYEVLAGVRPYDAASYPDLVVKIAMGAAAPLETLRPGLPPGLAAVVHKAMAPSPGARFASVDALMQALRPFAAQLAPPLSAARALEPRKLRVSPAVAAGTLALLFAAALAWITFSEANETAEPVQQLRPLTITSTTPQPTAAEPVETSKAAASAPPEATAPPEPGAAEPQPDRDEPAATAAPEARKPDRSAKAAPRKPRQEPLPPRLPIGPAPAAPAALGLPKPAEAAPPPTAPANEPKPVRGDRPSVRLDRDGF